MTPEAFAAFTEPGWGRIAANFTVLAYTPLRTLVSYEVRTATADPDSARRFARYWTFIRPFVGHIMGTTRPKPRPRVPVIEERAHGENSATALSRLMACRCASSRPG